MAAHGFLSLEFWVAYLVLLVVTGAAVPVTIAFLGAIAISHFVRTRYTEKEEPIPSQSAIVITGASTGIGADAALAFSKEGFTVFAVLRKQTDAEALLSRAESTARDRLVPILCDITVKEQLQRARDDVASELKKRGLYLHALINNAGLGNSGPLELLTLESLRRQFEVNVFAQVAVTQAFMSLLREPAPSGQTLSRRIIFTSSVVGHITFPTYGPYASSKQALESLIDALRNEVKPWNIDVVSIAPGRIASNFSSTNNSNIQANIDQAKQQGGGEFPVPSDVLSVYEAMQKKFLAKIAANKYQTTQVTTDAFRLALLAKRPPTRAPAGKDATVLVPFAVNIPDRLRDYLFGV